MPETNDLLKVYAEHHTELVTAENRDAAITFDYEDEADNKKARSHVHTLRGQRAAVDKTRVAEKAGALAYGRMVDSQAKSITEHFTVLIDRHAKPLQAIENREKDRVTELQEQLDNLRAIATLSNEPTTIEQLRKRLEILNVPIGPHWQELAAAALRIQQDGNPVLEKEIARLEKLAADQVELDKLRKVQEARDREIRDDQIREQTKRDAELGAKKREEAAAQEVRDAFAREELRKKALADDEARYEAERQTNIEHRGQIETEAMEAIAQGLDGVVDDVDDVAGMIIDAIIEGKVPHVTVNY